MKTLQMGQMIALALASVMFLGSERAFSSTLGLSVQPAPEINGSGSAANNPFLFGFDLLAEGATSIAPAAASDLDIRIAGLFGVSPAALNIGPDPATLFLGGVQSDLGFEFSTTGLDTIEILFSGLTGSAASFFGTSVLAVITGEFGDDESALFSTGFAATPASVVINPVAVIPLPAGLPLLISAVMSAFCLLRHRGDHKISRDQNTPLTEEKVTKGRVSRRASCTVSA